MGRHRTWSCLCLLAGSTAACAPSEDSGPSFTTGLPTSTSLSTTGSGTDDTGDGDGGTTAGDGDGTTAGDGDGTTTGDGDGTTAGDGDGTTTGGAMTCGNSIIEGVETCDCGSDGMCDAAELGNVSCADLMDPVSGNMFNGGTLDCNLSCFHVTTGCTVCGNNQLDPGEPCDGTMLGSSTCGSAGFLGGTIQCASDCSYDTSMCSMAAWSDGFESGDFTASPWGGAGNLPWVIETVDPASGTFSARSGAIDHNQTSDLTIQMDFPANAVLALSYKTDTESCCDHLQLLIDGAQVGMNQNGSQGWTEVTAPAPMGSHLVTFRYTKDGSADTGADAVWIDDVRSDGMPAAGQCGDGNLIFAEECDGAMLGGRTCGSEGFLGGTLSCDGLCMLDTSACTTATFTDGFESGDFTAGPWTQGTSPWTIDSAAFGGMFSARSGSIGANGTSELSVPLNWSAPGVIAFGFQTDTESCCDDLEFLIDGGVQNTWSGSNAWTDVNFPVAAGMHTLTWRYTKDGSVDTGQDAVWIDEVRADATP